RVRARLQHPPPLESAAPTSKFPAPKVKHPNRGGGHRANPQPRRKRCCRLHRRHYNGSTSGLKSYFERRPLLCVTKHRMQLEHAEHTLETIRTLMERSQRYEHLSGYSGLVAGALALAGCAALAKGWSAISF